MTSRAITLQDDDHGREFRRWSLAALIVLAGHLGLMGTYFLFFKSQPQGMPDSPAILIDMSPPAAPASPKDAEMGPVQEEVPPEQQVMEITPPEPVIEPPPPIPMESPVVLQAEPPKPQVTEKPKEPPPEKKVEPKKKPVQKTTAGPRSERAADQMSAPTAGASGAAMADWRSMVVSKLQAAKRYPSGSESRREQGVVTLSFTLSRCGAVLSRSIARSSGYPDLDQEVLSMVQRAAPFPPFPTGMNQASQHLTAPVRFSLR